jgi:hypothetical protein
MEVDCITYTAIPEEVQDELILGALDSFGSSVTFFGDKKGGVFFGLVTKVAVEDENHYTIEVSSGCHSQGLKVDRAKNFSVSMGADSPRPDPTAPYELFLPTNGHGLAVRVIKKDPQHTLFYIQAYEKHEKKHRCVYLKADGDISFSVAGFL